MAVPTPETAPRSPLEQIDTTITLAELEAIAGWPKPTKIQSGGRVLLALHVDGDHLLRLSVVEHDTGTVAQFPITGADLGGSANDTHDGNTFPPRSQDGDHAGPIVFAIRVRRSEDEPANAQIAVFSDGASLRVAMRQLGEPAWTPRFRIDFARGAKFVGIGTTYPH